MMTLRKFLQFFGLIRRKQSQRVMGRRKAIMRILLTHKFLDPYEIAERSGMPMEAATKVLSSAYRDNEPIERIKRKVKIPNPKKRTIESVWCYRKRPSPDLAEQVHAQLSKEVEEMNGGEQQTIPLLEEREKQRSRPWDMTCK